MYVSSTYLLIRCVPTTYVPTYHTYKKRAPENRRPPNAATQLNATQLNATQLRTQRSSPQLTTTTARPTVTILLWINDAQFYPRQTNHSFLSSLNQFLSVGHGSSRYNASWNRKKRTAGGENCRNEVMRATASTAITSL